MATKDDFSPGGIAQHRNRARQELATKNELVEVEAKYLGTAADQSEMRVLGRRQVLRVQIPKPRPAYSIGFRL